MTGLATGVIAVFLITNIFYKQHELRRLIGGRCRSPGPELPAPPRCWRWAEAKQVIGVKGCATIAEATPTAEAFITPLLSGMDPGVWDPRRSAWSR